jgi:hypothetical protein
VENITKLAGSKQLQQEMSLASRQRALELDWRNSVVKIKEIYDQL